MFRGISSISVDAKGRVAIPKKHRARLQADNANDLMVTAGPERCLLVYPMEAWLPTEKKILALPNTDPLNRRMQRMYVGHAMEAEIDKTGRILVPAVLRDYASIGDQAIMLGQGHRLELWGEDMWNSKSQSWPEDLEDIGQDELSEAARDLSL